MAGSKAVKTGIRTVTSLVVNLLIVFLILQLFNYAFNFTYDMFAQVSFHPGDKTEVTVVILPDSSVKEIVEVLDEAGVIENKYVLMAKIYLGKYHSQLMPGTYQVSPSMTYDDILVVISGEAEE